MGERWHVVISANNKALLSWQGDWKLSSSDGAWPLPFEEIYGHHSTFYSLDHGAESPLWRFSVSGQVINANHLRVLSKNNEQELPRSTTKLPWPSQKNFMSDRKEIIQVPITPRGARIFDSLPLKRE